MRNYNAKIRLNILVFVQNPTKAALTKRQAITKHKTLNKNHIHRFKIFMYTNCIHNNK